MPNIQPQWQSDDGDAVPVRIAKNATDAPVTGDAIPLSAVSRRPAAIIGILVAVAMGAVALNLQGTFTAQVVSETVVHITADGFDPQSISVTPGGKIRWRNDDAIPHIIASSTLNTKETSPLESLPIFPGEEYVTTVKQDMPPGNFDYISRTSDFNGTIVIDDPSAVSDAMESSSGMEVAAPQIPTKGSSSSRSLPRVNLPTTASVAGTTTVPVNPYTADKVGIRTTTTTAIGGPVPPPAITKTVTKPAAQPTSGSGAFVVVFMATFSVWMLWRKALVA